MFWKKRSGSSPSIQEGNKEELFPIAKSGEEHLELETRKNLILKIKRLLSVTEQVWLKHYYQPLVTFAQLAQYLPASENYHHSHKGGLIDHSLEVVYQGIRIGQGYVLPPNSSPESLIGSKDRWLHGLFITLLAHDLGKIVTEFDLVSKDELGNYKSIHPWFDGYPVGSPFIFRFKTKRSGYDKRVHEKASISLLPKLLNPEACASIFSDMDLLTQMMNTLSHSQIGGGVIQEIVRQADGRSVANNVGADQVPLLPETGTINSVPEKLLMGINHLINDGYFSYNKPGAAFWKIDGYIWLVSKAGMEAVQSFLINQGHTGIPKHVVRLFDILNESGIAETSPNGSAIWKAEVNDLQKNWRQSLTFLKLKIERLSINRDLLEFDGVIEADGLLKDDSSIQISNQQTSSKEEVVESVEPTQVAAQNLSEQPSTRPDHSFFDWLIRSVRQRKIRVNEPKAPVHLTDKGVLLVTPSIFNSYLEGNKVKKRLYASKDTDKRPYVRLQKEIESLGIHRRSIHGKNIFSVKVTGPRTTKELKAYVFSRNHFPEFKLYSSNAAIELIED